VLPERLHREQQEVGEAGAEGILRDIDRRVCSVGEDHVRASDRLRIATDRGAVLVEHARERVGGLHRGGVGRPHVARPHVGAQRGDAQRALWPIAPDPKRRVRRLERLWLGDRVRQLVVPPLERCTWLGPERLQHLAGLIEAIDAFRGALRERHPVHRELWLVPPSSDPHLETAAGEVIDRDGDLREQAWMPVEIPGDVEADVRALGDLRDRREERPPVVDRLRLVLMDRDQVVEEPEVIEAGVVDHAPRLSLRFEGEDLLRELETDTDRHSPSPATAAAAPVARRADCLRAAVSTASTICV
jgi:hypothetical protein